MAHKNETKQTLRQTERETETQTQTEMLSMSFCCYDKQPSEFMFYNAIDPDSNTDLNLAHFMAKSTVGVSERQICIL